MVWQQPATPPPVPIHTVVKNTVRPTSSTETVERSLPATASTGGGDGDVARQRNSQLFHLEVLDKSIKKSLRNRPADRQSLAASIRDYVLWGLAGQTTVRSSQLSTKVVEALRGLDDLAYLRWVCIGKELMPVDTYIEAAMLVQYPSPPLTFSTVSLPSMHPLSTATALSVQ